MWAHLPAALLSLRTKGNGGEGPQMVCFDLLTQSMKPDCAFRPWARERVGFPGEGLESSRLQARWALTVEDG